MPIYSSMRGARTLAKLVGSGIASSFSAAPSGSRWAITTSRKPALAGVYWTAEQVATWHHTDFVALGERLSLTGVSAMAIRGELCFSCDS